MATRNVKLTPYQHEYVTALLQEKQVEFIEADKMVLADAVAAILDQFDEAEVAA